MELLLRNIYLTQRIYSGFYFAIRSIPLLFGIILIILFPVFPPEFPIPAALAVLLCCTFRDKPPAMSQIAPDFPLDYFPAPLRDILQEKSFEDLPSLQHLPH